MSVKVKCSRDFFDIMPTVLEPLGLLHSSNGLEVSGLLTKKSEGHLCLSIKIELLSSVQHN